MKNKQQQQDKYLATQIVSNLIYLIGEHNRKEDGFKLASGLAENKVRKISKFAHQISFFFFHSLESERKQAAC